MANVTDPLAAARSETIEWVLRHDKLEAENAELRAELSAYERIVDMAAYYGVNLKAARA